MATSTPPRVLGGLLTLLGVALLGGGLHVSFNLDGDGTYYMVVGTLLALSGIGIFAGKWLSLFVYGATLMTVWVWSFAEVGSHFDALMPRVAFPTLIALYLYSSKVRSRLS